MQSLGSSISLHWTLKGSVEALHSLRHINQKKLPVTVQSARGGELSV
ncbi:hypothetical protein SAMN05518856_10849 [Paenibacillus sp. OK003]|nr:hypothetical protein SAMN05518856_10849 [Paenibacillus sp. OK003]